MKKKKVLALILITGSLTAFASLFLVQQKKPKLNYQTQSKNQKSKNLLTHLWKKDVIKMFKDQPKQKKYFSSLVKNKVFLLDEDLHPFFKGLKSPFKTSKKGKYILESSFMSHFSEEDQRKKIIIQYNLIDPKSEEMLWEDSRLVHL